MALLYNNFSVFLIMTRFLIVIFSFLFSVLTTAQPDSSAFHKVDSLVNEYIKVSQSNPTKSLTFLDSAQNIAKQINYKKGIADITRQRGLFYTERGDVKTSMKMLYDALKIDEEINNQKGVGKDYLYIGLNYYYQQKYNEALEEMKKGLDVYSKINDAYGEVLIIANMGMIYREFNKYEQALECYYKAKNYYAEQKKEINLSAAENNIGNVYVDMKNYDEAIKHFLIAKQLKTKNNQQYSLVYTLSNIGDVYVEKKEFNKAFEYYNQALKIAEEQKSTSLLKDVYFDISAAHEKNGNYKKALETFKASTSLKDSIVTEEYQVELADMKIKYGSEKKENENKILKTENELKTEKLTTATTQKIFFAVLSAFVIIVAFLLFFQYQNKRKINKQLELVNQKINSQNNTLKQLNTELIYSEDQLTQMNATKSQLISMLSHDLYNPVTSIISYTNEIVTTANNLNPEEFKNSFIKLNNAAIPLKDLLDNILQWAKTQKQNIQPRIETVDLTACLEEVCFLYQPTAVFKKIKFSMLFDKNIQLSSDKLMIYFIFRNIINNAVKFSPSNKTLSVQAIHKNDFVSVVIKDEGKGFSIDTLASLNAGNHQLAAASAEGSGIGLSISLQFVKLLNAKISFENNAHGGACVTISFPRA